MRHYTPFQYWLESRGLVARIPKGHACHAVPFFLLVSEPRVLSINASIQAFHLSRT